MKCARSDSAAKAKTSNELDSEKIRQLENARYTAIQNGDYDAFERLSHSSLIYSHSSGNTDRGSQYIEKCREGFYRYHHIDHPIEFIQITGDLALVVGEMNAQITVGGEDKTLRNRCLAVWIRTSGEWRFIAYQPTPVTAN